ncbi:MAG: glycosyltransferase [Verrucomicrobiota bacterium]
MTPVLFIAFELPPLAAGGVYRPLAFLKYLPEFGIEPVVLTTDEESYRQVIVNPGLDHSLLDRIPANTRLHRIPCAKPQVPARNRFGEWKRIFFSLAEEAPKAWEPNLLIRISEIARQERPKAIVATAPPFYAATLACRIAQELSLPLVLDLRDAWSQWRMGPYGSYLHYLLTLRMERRCLMAADRVVTTSSQTRADLLRIHPRVPAEKIVVITNGYDCEISNWTQSRAGASPAPCPSPKQPESPPCSEALASRPLPSRPFVIGYVGTFYYSPGARAAMMQPWWQKPPHRMIQYSPRIEDWLYRSPYFFFKAVAALLADHPEYQTRLRIRFAGRKPDWIQAQVNKFDLGNIVEFVGPLEHAASLKFQSECDALLLTSSKVIGGSDYSIAGKTFEYFSMRKPILGFVAEGAQKDLLTESGMAVICDPDNAKESATKLHNLISGRTRLEPNAPFLKTLHRRDLTCRLAKVSREVVGGATGLKAEKLKG